jgi:type IV secretion system protein VirB9
MKTLCIQVLFFWGLIARAVLAQPTSVSADTRIVTFEFDPDQSYLVLTRPKSVTHIQLSSSEQITTAVAGDTSNFSVAVSANRSSVLVRPKYEGLTTSLTLITNARSYPIVLRSTPEGTGKWYQRVSWHLEEMGVEMPGTSKGIMPFGTGLRSSTEQGQRLELSVEDLEQSNTRARPRGNPVQSADLMSRSNEESETLSFDLERMSQLRTQYTVSGSADFKPIQVFDDGQKMYLHLPPEMQHFPAIFAIEEGRAQLINFSLSNHFVIIQGVHSELLLKSASLEVNVKRDLERQGFWGGIFHANR